MFFLIVELFTMLDNFKLGIGIGEISTGFEKEAIGMDGTG